MVDRNSRLDILKPFINRHSNLFDALSVYPCIQCGANTQLLHVFQEDFILGYKPQKEPEAYTPAFPPGGGIAQCYIKTLPRSNSFLVLVVNQNSNVILLYPDYLPAPFSEKFFLVVIEKDLNRNSVLQMWHLHLKSVQACVGKFWVKYKVYLFLSTSNCFYWDLGQP